MEVIKWSRLKKIQRVKLVKGMYIWLFIVPLCAKAFEKVSDIATVTIFDYTFDLQFTLPFTWQLFYFSAVFFVLGNLLFYVYCPRLVNEHDSYSDFDGSGKNMQQLSEYIFEMNLDQSALRSEVGVPVDPGAEQKQNAYQDMFWSVHKKADVIYSSTRVFIGVFYLIAILLIAIVFMENTDLVIASILNNI